MTTTTDDNSQDYTPIDHGELDGDNVKSKDLNSIGHLAGTNEDGQHDAANEQGDNDGTVEDPDGTTEDVEPQSDAVEPPPEEEAETLGETNQEPELSDATEGDEAASPQADDDSDQPSTDRGNRVGYNLRSSRARDVRTHTDSQTLLMSLPARRAIMATPTTTLQERSSPRSNSDRITHRQSRSRNQRPRSGS